MEVIKAYKGFNPDMTCRGKRYEEGKDYEEERAEACECGMHACEYPLDCFFYYAPGNSVYHEVIQSGEISRSDEDSKIASTKMHIGARLDIAGLVKAAVNFTKSNVKENIVDEKSATAGGQGAATAGNRGAATAGGQGAATAGDQGAATAGDRGAATAGNQGAATAGDWGAATAGNQGAATAGYRGAATAGDRGAATAGYQGAATAGDRGAATAGDRGAATAGDWGAAISRGSASVGENGTAISRGIGVKAKAGIGGIIVIIEENLTNCGIKSWKAEIVDGEKIKPDTWYMLKNGELVEVHDDM